MKENVIDFLKVAGVSVLCFLCVCWTAGTDILNAYWSEAIVFFAITYFLCNHYSINGKLSAGGVAIASGIGRVALELPIRLPDFSNALGSIMLTIESLLAIFMAWVCWTYKKPVVFILTLVIFILINSFIPEMWENFVLSRMSR